MEGENGFKVYLASSTDFFLEFFFLRACGILYSLAWRHFIFLSKILSAFPRSFGDSFNISGLSNCCPETRLCFFARSCGIRSPVLSRRPLSSKTAFFIPISADEKGASGFRVLANHLASFFFLHPVRRFILATIRTSVPLLYPPGWGYGVQIAWPTFFTSFNRGAEELTYIPYSSFQRSIFEAC